MDYISLKHTQLSVSRICLGTMTFGGQADEATAARMVECCLDAGINFIDTANIYSRGISETILGKLLKGRRQQFVLASKVCGKMGEAPDESGLSKAAIHKAIDGTLRRLGTSYLDLYYLHQPDYTIPLQETLATMDDLVRAGKVRYPACSNYAAWQIVQMQWLAQDHNYRPIYITQPMYNLLARGIEQEFLPMCREFGLSTIVYNPLAGGFLTGKHKREAPPAPGTRFDKNQLYQNRYWHPSAFDAVDELRQLAERSGRSLVSLSLNWLLHHTAADCIILGASRVEHLEENLKAAGDGPLPPDLLAACEAVSGKLRGVTPKYNR